MALSIPPEYDVDPAEFIGPADAGDDDHPMGDNYPPGLTCSTCEVCGTYTWDLGIPSPCRLHQPRAWIALARNERTRGLLT